MATVFPLEAGGLAHFHDSQGDPLQGGKIYFYITGTSTPKNTYSESTGTTANANPVVLDSRGEAAIYVLGDAAYKMVVKDSDDVTLYTRDPVYGLLDSGAISAALTAETSPAVADEVIIQDVSEGAANKITLANLLKVVGGLTAETLPTTSDELLLHDASASTADKITLDVLRTALPMRGHIGGLTLSNNGTDATNDIDIAVGEASDSAVACVMRLTSAITKRLDAAWAVGTGNGGLDTGAIANDVYHVWLIRRSDTGVVDALFSASATSPTMPTNYDQKRRIGAIIRASAAILPFTQFGDHVTLTTPVLDVDVSNPGGSAVTRTLSSVPDGVRVKARLNVFNTNSAAADDVYISELAATDQATSGTVSPLSTLTSQNNLNETMVIEVMTNTSAQIRTRHGTGTNTSFRITTLGWTDYRDRYL